MESLYRKYRPQTFDTMVGQKHIIATLENALSEGRTAHAYLFSGPRGTGKTTTARLLAKALLCEHGPTPHPDGTCEQCEEIARGTHPDVYELDAASRTGVDNVREEIINRVAFAPTRGRYKIYIIDEVHMLTTQAFNALLKTLEEPPSHVVFVMCTTDPQKVPETILSRCQRLEFHRITTSDIEDRLAYVCEHEGYEADPEALRLVAKHARGGLRDALSMLEQLSVFGDGSVRLEDAQSVLGEASDDALGGLVAQVAARDVAGCFAQVASLAERGTDIAQFARDLAGYVRNLYVASVAGAKGFEDEKAAEAYVGQAEACGGPDRLAYMLEVLGQLEGELRTSLDQRLSLEVALTRMARPASDLTLESLAARVADLERELAALKAGGAITVAPVAAAPAAGAPAPAAALGASMASSVPATSTATPASAAARPMPTFRPSTTAATQPAAAPSSGAAPAVQRGAGAASARPWANVTATAGRAQTAPTSNATATPAATAAPAPASAAATAQRQAAAPTPAPAAQQVPVSRDPGADQRMWGRVVDSMVRSAPSIGALLRNMEGILGPDGKTLTVVNHGSDFAAKMLARQDSRRAVERAASEAYGCPITIAIAGLDSPAGQRPAAPAAPTAQAPTTPTTASPTVAAAEPASTPASASAAAPVTPRAIPSAAAIAAAAAAAVQGGGASTPSRAAGPSPSAASVAGSAASGTSSATRPTPKFTPTPPVRSAEPEPEAPPFEFVPDDLYDSYDFAPEDDGFPTPSPEARAVEALSGASKEPIAAPDAAAGKSGEENGAASKPGDDLPPWKAPAPTTAQQPARESAGQPAGQSASPAVKEPPVKEPITPSGADGGFDMDAINLSQMLSAGFGGYVKVTSEK